jgi:hypothetical protein
MTHTAAPPPLDADVPTPLDAPAAPSLPSTIDVPRDTTPTFEIEMLVSGATLFGLFQLPALLDALVAHYQPHLGLLGIFLAGGVGLARQGRDLRADRLLRGAPGPARLLGGAGRGPLGVSRRRPLGTDEGDGADRAGRDP